MFFNLFSKEKETKGNKSYFVFRFFGIKFKFQDKNYEIEKLKTKIKNLEINHNYKLCRYMHPEMYPEYLKDWFYKNTGEVLNLENPKTFRQKIQWLKLYDSTPLKTRLADKYLVREYIKEKIGEKYLINLIGVYDNFDEIDFDKLPKSFVLKCNHGCGYNIIVKDKSKFNIGEARKKVNYWMNQNYAFVFGLELQYLNIQRKIIIEEYIEDLDNCAIDYKFLCFSANPELCWITDKSKKIHDRCFYSLPDWKKQNIQYLDGTDKIMQKELPKPQNLEEIIEICKILSKDFSFVRVDVYVAKEKIYFGELTFTSSSGCARFVPDELNYILGDKIILPQKSKEYSNEKQFV